MESVLDIEKNAANDGLDELLTFVGLPSKRSAKELTGSSQELFEGIVSVLNNLLLRAIDKQTAQEFVAARGEVFGDFFKTTRAMSNLRGSSFRGVPLNGCLGSRFRSWKLI